MTVVESLAGSGQLQYVTGMSYWMIWFGAVLASLGPWSRACCSRQRDVVVFAAPAMLFVSSTLRIARATASLAIAVARPEPGRAL